MSASTSIIYPTAVTLIRARPEDPVTVSVGNDTLNYGTTTSLGSSLSAGQSATFTSDRYVQTAANGAVLLQRYNEWDAEGDAGSDTIRRSQAFGAAETLDGVYYQSVSVPASHAERGANRDAVFFANNISVDSTAVAAGQAIGGFATRGTHRGAGNFDAYYVNAVNDSTTGGELGLFIGTAEANAAGNGALFGGHFQLIADVAANMRALHLDLQPNVDIAGGGKTAFGLDVSNDDAVFSLTQGSRVRGLWDSYYTAYSDNAATSLVFNVTATSVYTVGGFQAGGVDAFVATANGGKDTIALTNTNAGVGITIGADTNLYRAAANTLGTDDKLQVALELEVDGALNHDGTTVGFYGVTPTTRSSAYTPTNVTPDRAFDADTVVVAELADVVGTLIADLQATGLIG